MWSKKAELKYWDGHNNTFHDANILKKYRFFDVDSYFPGGECENVVDLAVDIGGGAFGGALPFFFKAKRRILVDALAKEFRMLGKLVGHIDSITADFANTPLANEAADVLFCWNTLDHANDLCHFDAGMTELVRLAADDGLLFLSVPMRARNRVNKNHPLVIERKMVIEHLSQFEIVNEFVIGKPEYCDNILFLVARKI